MAHQDDPVGLQGEVSTSPKRRLVFTSGVCGVIFATAFERRRVHRADKVRRASSKPRNATGILAEASVTCAGVHIVTQFLCPLPVAGLPVGIEKVSVICSRKWIPSCYRICWWQALEWFHTHLAPPKAKL